METLIVDSTTAALGVRPDTATAERFSRAATLLSTYRHTDGYVVRARRNDYPNYDAWHRQVEIEQRLRASAFFVVNDLLDTVARRRAPYSDAMNSDCGITHPDGPRCWTLNAPVLYDAVTELKKGGLVGAAIQFGPVLHVGVVDGPDRARRLVALLRQIKAERIDATLEYPMADTEMANAIRASRWFVCAPPDNGGWVRARYARPDEVTYARVEPTTNNQACIGLYNESHELIGYKEHLPEWCTDLPLRTSIFNAATMGLFFGTEVVAPVAPATRRQGQVNASTAPPVLGTDVADVGIERMHDRERVDVVLDALFPIVACRNPVPRGAE